MDEHIFRNLLSNLIVEAPDLVLYVVGAVVALIYISRAPKPALLALLGFGLLIGFNLATAVWYAISWELLDLWGFDPDDREGVVMLTNVLVNVLHVAAFLPILMAIFAGRRKSVPPPMPED